VDRFDRHSDIEYRVFLKRGDWWAFGPGDRLVTASSFPQLRANVVAEVRRLHGADLRVVLVVGAQLPSTVVDLPTD